MRDVPGSDFELVRALRAGDEDAFRTVYSRLQAQVFRFALHMSGSRSLAEDIVQEAFMTLIHRSDRFDPERGSLAAFVLGSPATACFGGSRKSGRLSPSLMIAGKGTKRAAGRLGPALRAGSFRNGAPGERRSSDPPAHYREVIVLCELEERSYEEAAELLACSLGTVRSRLHRARALLLKKFFSPAKGRRKGQRQS